MIRLDGHVHRFFADKKMVVLIDNFNFVFHCGMQIITVNSILCGTICPCSRREDEAAVRYRQADLLCVADSAEPVKRSRQNVFDYRRSKTRRV